MKYVNTWADACPVGMDLCELALCDRGGTPLCLIRSNPMVEFQRPPLLGREATGAMFHLLSHLKTAYCSLLLQSQLLSATVQSSDLEIFVAFDSDMQFPDDSSVEAYLKWLDVDHDRPLLISGVAVRSPGHKSCYLDFDLKIRHPERPDYSGVLHPSFFAPLLVSIRFYNGVVKDFWLHGFRVLSVFTLNDLAMFAPDIGAATGLSVIEI